MTIFAAFEIARLCVVLHLHSSADLPHRTFIQVICILIGKEKVKRCFTLKFILFWNIFLRLLGESCKIEDEKKLRRKRVRRFCLTKLAAVFTQKIFTLVLPMFCAAWQNSLAKCFVQPSMESTKRRKPGRGDKIPS